MEFEMWINNKIFGEMVTYYKLPFGLLQRNTLENAANGILLSGKCLQNCFLYLCLNHADNQSLLYIFLAS